MCDGIAGMLMTQQEPGQRHRYSLYAHSTTALKGKFEKLQTAVIRVDMTVLSLAFLSSVASIPSAHSLSLSSLSVSFNTLPPYPFFFFFFLLLPSLLFPPSTLPSSSPGDSCPRHLCSVSQMSHNRNRNINLAVDTAEK